MISIITMHWTAWTPAAKKKKTLIHSVRTFNHTDIFFVHKIHNNFLKNIEIWQQFSKNTKNQYLLLIFSSLFHFLSMRMIFSYQRRAFSQWPQTVMAASNEILSLANIHRCSPCSPIHRYVLANTDKYRWKRETVSLDIAI